MMAPQRNVFALLTLALYTLQAVGQTIVLDQSLVAAATASEPASDPTATGSLRITVSDDGTINIDIPLNVRNDIGFILDSVPDLVNRTEQVQQVMENNNYDVQKKGIGSAAFAAEFAGLVAILLAKPLSKTVPVHLKFPPGDAMDQVGAAAKANPKPSVAIIQENAQDPGSLVTVPLVDEASATGSSISCPTGAPQRFGCPCAPPATWQEAATVAASLWSANIALYNGDIAMAATMPPAPSTSSGPNCKETTSAFGCNLPTFCLCGGDGGGVVVPLTETVVSSTTISNCNYLVAPTIDNCPDVPMTTLATTTVPTATAPGIPLTAAATVSASCYPTYNLRSLTYNPADVTPAAVSFCSTVLSSHPLSTAYPAQNLLPGNDPALALRAGLQGPSSCNDYADEDECMRDMLTIMSQCPKMGGTFSAPCALFMYRVVTVV